MENAAFSERVCSIYAVSTHTTQIPAVCKTEVHQHVATTARAECTVDLRV